MQKIPSRVVVLATGGTIAGAARDAADNVGYTAAQLGVDELVAAVPALASVAIETEQVAQLDSKDMDHATWLALARRCAHHLARADVSGIVVTHGTDTLEETAWFLQRALAPARPVVLASAMRPATALLRDGPQNLLDAVALAQCPGARGVVAVLAGRVHAARDVRKVHPYRIDAFASGDAGPVAVVEEGRVRRFRPWPADAALVDPGRWPEPSDWPWVEIVASHAGASGAAVRALVAAGVRGIVVAGTGNGSLHRALQAALEDAEAAGVRVLRSTRCRDGRLVDHAQDRWPGCGDLTPEKARIELLLDLLPPVGDGTPGVTPRST